MVARKRLGELLVEDGAIDETQLRAALGHQRQWGGKLGQTLVDLKLVSEPQVVSALARRLECEVARLDALRPNPELTEALKAVSAELARKHLAMPVSATRTLLTVAMADPANVAAVDELSFRTGRRVKPLLAGQRDVERALQRFYGHGMRDDAIQVDFDVHADAPEEGHVFDSSPAKFQERFYRSSMREPPPPPELARAPALTPPPVAGMAPATVANPARPATAAPTPLVAALARMTGGAEVPSLPPGALVAAVTSVLMRRGLVTEAEVLQELWRARGAAQVATPVPKKKEDGELTRPL